MSKFGMKIAGETVYGIVSPDHALELVEKIVGQYFGEYWTQHKPRCPLCDSALCDTEKHMNKPVGECTNPTCNSTIHIADFFGKIKDILGEWDHVKDDWKDKVKQELRKKSNDTVGFHPSHTGSAGTNTNIGTNSAQSASSSESDTLTMVDSDTVFVW